MTTVTVIGGGPAGYVAAITAAQQGTKVFLIEGKALGGTCLNEGCMPTKALLESASRFENVKKAHHLGIEVQEDAIQINWAGVQGYKNKISNQLVNGIHFLMKKNKIEVINGEASFLNNHQIEVRTKDGIQKVTSDKMIIATGSTPVEIPSVPFDGEWVIDSSQALTLSEIPSSLLIVGGGVIGCEFASIFSRLGTEVTIVEMQDNLLPEEDPDIVSVLANNLTKTGVNILSASKLTQVDKAKKQVLVTTTQGEEHFEPSKLLIAVGRKPRVTGLNLENIGLKFTTNQGIHVNEQMETNVPDIYACGDVIGGIQLAHVGFHEGRVAAMNACGKIESVNYHVVPRCIYTSPEIACIGLNEKHAREEYGDIRIGQFSFNANGKALIHGENFGKVKVIVEAQYNEIVGLSIVGPLATELIGQGSIMMHSEMTADSMKDMISAHPTLSEAIHEALLSVFGEQLHG